MSNYPFLLDNIFTLPTVSGVDDKAVAINALQDAVLAIEEELGIKPSFPYSDVRVRLDILESRINFGVSPSIPNDGYVKSPLYILNEVQGVTLSISDGYGAPTENRLDGSLYMRADGYANNDFYIRRDGYWVPIVTEAFIAAGDLSGDHLSQKVIGIRTKPLNVSLESIGAIQDGYHLTWNDSGGYWEAQTGFIAGSDLAIDSPFFGRTGQRVVRLQNRTLSSAAPGGSTSSDGDGLAWDPSTSQWQPRPRAVIFDGYVARSNLRSNKLLQSPIDNTKAGIVNFGSRSAGATPGATENYAAILSGDRHVASGNFGVIVGGDSHIASAQYSFVADGYGNSSIGQYGSIINGLLNVASGTYSAILDGYSLVASGNNSFVINGGNHSAAAPFSGILNGISNTISAGSQHAGIGWGNLNSISGTAIFALILGGSGNVNSAQNAFIGNASNASVLSSYGFIGTGLGVASTTQRINTSSEFATILNGSFNLIQSNSFYGFIGSGNTNTVTGLHATILNGANNITDGNYALIANGNNNTISGNIPHAVIIDGYQNTVSAAGSIILDGYLNSVSGIYSSIFNGNNNSISGRNSSVLNGASNSIDVNSFESTVLNGNTNVLVSSPSVVVSGNGNNLTGINHSIVLGTFNTISSGSFNQVFGTLNTFGLSTTHNAVFGANNILLPNATANLVVGSSHIVDGYSNNVVLGTNNIISSELSLVQGKFGKSRLYGQQVHANSRFTSGFVGEAQWSRVILSGNANSGGSINIRLQDGSPDGYVTLVDGYSYEINLRILIVNNQASLTNGTLPVRFVYDILAHQEGGTLVLDNVNETLVSKATNGLNPVGSTWTVTITAVGNQLRVVVDPEVPPYLLPANNPSDRRAVATLEWREISRA